jgi:hypothetical protein
MPKKNRKSDLTNDMGIESAAKTSGEVTPSDARLQEEAANMSLEEQEASDPETNSASEDLLDDVRRSLIEEEETDRSKKESKWWRRIGRKEQRAAPQPPPSVSEIDLPTTSSQIETIEDQNTIAEPDEYAEQLNDLIDMLDAEHQKSDTEARSTIGNVGEVEIPPEIQPELDFEQLKEQAFRPRSSDETVQSDSDVRSIALESGEEVFVEVEVKAPDPFEERLKAFENALKPYRSYIYMVFTFLGIVMAVMAALLIFNVYQRSKPQTVKEVPNLPYPVAVSLPGGWSFNLGTGALQGGKWEPVGAEWLEGTEVCRWVSLPWSLQLEAVLRTLNPKDPIELVMSNNDKLVYGVYSVYEMTTEEIQALDANSPCLLIILSGADSEKRWVLTALP